MLIPLLLAGVATFAAVVLVTLAAVALPVLCAPLDQCPEHIARRIDAETSELLAMARARAVLASR